MLVLIDFIVIVIFAIYTNVVGTYFYLSRMKGVYHTEKHRKIRIIFCKLYIFLDMIVIILAILNKTVFVVILGIVAIIMINEYIKDGAYDWW